MKLSIIIFHHGPAVALQRCLDALANFGAPQREIIVVQNVEDCPPQA